MSGKEDANKKKEEKKTQVVQTIVKGNAKGKMTLSQIKELQKQREEQNKKMAEAQSVLREQEKERIKAAKEAQEAKVKKEEAKEVNKVATALRRFRFGERQSAAVVDRTRVQKGKAVKETEFPKYKSPICCILGHVDTGKTKLLDKLRESDVQGGEAGGITQQIGATFFPMATLIEKYSLEPTEIPGILIIDTPGHESFSNLRSRGSSLCNIAILVIDILHGIEPQTAESIQLLRARKTPFVVALNKIDRIYDWKMGTETTFQERLAAQARHAQSEFESLSNNVIAQLAAYNLNAALWYENPEPRKVVSLVPVSAITGEGIPDLMTLIFDLSLKYMSGKMLFSETPECTVLEVKQTEGFGTTLDAILGNGILCENDQIGICGTDGPIFTTIKVLLVPQPLKELRVKSQYKVVKRVVAAVGVKIVAHSLETALAGSKLILTRRSLSGYTRAQDSVRKELEEDANIASSFCTVEEGVVVASSTLGSLEALMTFLTKEKLPVVATALGRLRKVDVVRASVMAEKTHRAILCFNMKIDSDVTSYAEQLGVKIFTAEIIYHLLRDYRKYVDETTAALKLKYASTAVFPVKLRVIPNCVFNSRSPLVLGVEVLDGVIKVCTPLCVFKDGEMVRLGVVTSIEDKKKNVEKAVKGAQVAIKIEVSRNSTPRMFGRHVDFSDEIYSVLTKESTELLEEHFKSELSEDDKALLEDLKIKFGI